MSNSSVNQRRRNIHEWLAGVLGLAELVIEAGSIVVHLVEDTRKVDWEVSRAVAAVWSSTTIGDVGLVIMRVCVLSVPTTLEILCDKTLERVSLLHINETHKLSTNTAGARVLRKKVVPGTDAIEIQTEEGNGFLLGASRRGGLGGISRDHAEVIRKYGSLSRLIWKEVVGDWATVDELERAVRIFKIQLREPVDGFVFSDTGRSTL